MSDFPEVASEIKSTLLSKIFTFRNVFVFAVLVCLFVAGTTLRSSPEYSLYKLNQSMVNRDIDAFNYYFDTESVVNQLVNDAYADAEAKMKLEIEAQKSKLMNPWERIGSQLGQGLAVAVLEAIKPSLKKAATKFVNDNIHSAMVSSEGKEPPSYSIKEINQAGKIAFVTVINNDHNAEIKFVMRKQPEGDWKIISFDYELFKKFNES